MILANLFDLVLPSKEADFGMMLAMIAAPAITAAIVLLLPSRRAELLRWVAAFGAAFTLIVALCGVIDYYALLDSRIDRGGRPMHALETRLDHRVDAMTSADGRAPTPGPRLSADWVARFKWVERFDIYFTIGADGLSLSLIVLTAAVLLLAIAASWKNEKGVKGYLALLLFLETGVIGSFLALDLFAFFLFYEIMLLPMYFLIGVWGGAGRRRAAMKFVLYTFGGSAMILTAIVALYFADARDFVDASVLETRAEIVERTTPGLTRDQARERVEIHTLDVMTLSRMGQAAALKLSGQLERAASRGDDNNGPESVEVFGKGADAAAARERLTGSWTTEGFQYLIFTLLFVGFAVKIPLVPFHSWLPEAHVEAPTPVSMVLAGVLLKLGGYGLLRFAFPLAPWAAEQLAISLGIFAAVSIIWGGFAALGQTDFKRLLAYSSVSHMGFVVLGICSVAAVGRSQYWAWGVTGAAFQMVSHGITAAGLFFCVGVAYDRFGHRDLRRMGGLVEPMPVFAGLTAVLVFAAIGLPGLSGFVGELFVILGAWNFSPALAVPAIFSVILSAGYLLWAWQRAFLGTNPEAAKFSDLTSRELLILLPFVVMTVILGVVPHQSLLSWLEPATSGLADSLSRLRP